MLPVLMMAMALADATPQATVPGSRTLDPAMLIQQPSRIDRQRALDRYVSTRAYAYKGPLQVVLSCAVKKDGYLEACAIVEESPPGVGLGEMALRLSPKFRLPEEIGGVSVEGGRVNIPMHIAPSR